MAPVVSVENASLKGILCVTSVFPKIKRSVRNNKKKGEVFCFSLLFDVMLFMYKRISVLNYFCYKLVELFF